mgnify:CR=1
MPEAKITFSNGDVLTLTEDDVLLGVGLENNDEGAFSSISCSSQLERSIHDGLIPSILDVVCRYPYFYGPCGIETIYNSSAIVRIDIS